MRQFPATVQWVRRCQWVGISGAGLAFAGDISIKVSFDRDIEALNSWLVIDFDIILLLIIISLVYFSCIISRVICRSVFDRLKNKNFKKSLLFYFYSFI